MKEETTELLTVREASQLLKINEKKLYSLLKEGKLPGTKVTGKWLFPRAELEQFVSGKAHETVRKTFWESVINKKVLLVCGSDDPVIAMAQGLFHSAEPELLLFSSSVGSREGIRLLHDGFCTIAVSHLYDHEQDDFTFPFLGEFFKEDEVVLVNLFYRTIGYVFRQGTVTSLKECALNGMRFVNRQRGSGVRALVDRLMKEEGVDQASLKGYETEVYTHFDVVRSVAAGTADLGVATESVAASSKLGFRPVFEERFDMIVKRDAFFDRHVQAFVDFIRSERFRGLLGTMKGYDGRDTGRVIYPRPAASG
ncbi:MAG TPA: helix-turn-helix transcriptional regulator [Deltaproteobacteria bacterium]|nr:helix-turn-helix transcriptional regulator [Deltaproteobacteria bacterium]HOI08432.1 helix-turn-helix transcriptional regulator [Deltaproteobacteria bacterium]